VNLMRHTHFIGIGGSGLSAIARVLLERGEGVSGSDRQLSPPAEALISAGVQVFVGHRAENVCGADLVVRSSAIPDDNVEVREARALGIPVQKRSEFLGDLLNGYQVIAVAGTHGKTTTTSMIAWILFELGVDPSFIIGGISKNMGVNARAGKGPYFVIEADEYDRMFLGLSPAIAVVTNIEHDHPDCFPTPESFYQAFQEFAERLLRSGSLVACQDDPGANRLMGEVKSAGKHTVSYALEASSGGARMDYYPKNISQAGDRGFEFDLYRRGERLAEVSLQVPGVHNVRNALAALAVSDLLDLPLAETVRALNEFKGTGRRFDVRGEVRGITVIDDYAHHPTEIKTTLAAARTIYPQGDIWAVWQPHTYSRTRALMADYSVAFGDANHVLVTDIYAAREAPPANGFSSRKVVDALQHQDAHYSDGLTETADYLEKHLRPGSVLIVLSAGDADQVSTRILQSIESVG
jgi:UDP-N-acetylmuramate--alanine ligase